MVIKGYNRRMLKADQDAWRGIEVQAGLDWWTQFAYGAQGKPSERDASHIEARAGQVTWRARGTLLQSLSSSLDLRTNAPWDSWLSRKVQEDHIRVHNRMQDENDWVRAKNNQLQRCYCQVQVGHSRRFREALQWDSRVTPRGWVSTPRPWD